MSEVISELFNTLNIDGPAPHKYELDPVILESSVNLDLNSGNTLLPIWLKTL